MLGLSQLIERLPEFKNLRLRKTVIDKKNGVVSYTFSYPKTINEDDRRKIHSTIDALSIESTGGQQSYISSLYFIKDILNREIILDEIDNYNSQNYPSLQYEINKKTKVTLEDDRAIVQFNVDKTTADIVEKNGYLTYLSNYFKQISCFDYHFSVDYDYEEKDLQALLREVERNQQLLESKELSRPVRYLQIENVQRHIGKQIKYLPHYIADISNNSTSVVACGRLSKKQEYTSEKITSIICKFSLSDGTGNIDCVLFAKGKTLLAFRSLREGQEVVVSAKAKMSKYSGLMELTVFDLSLCNILPFDAQPKFTKQTPKQYIAVLPQPIQAFKQLDLGIFADNETKVSACNYLLENNVVAINLITTGQKVLTDKILCIDVVKIIRGEAKERFFCYLNPEKEFLPESIDLAYNTWTTDKSQENDGPVAANRHLLNNCYQSALTISQVVGDLYKFCEGCATVFYQMETQLSYLRYYSNAAGYYLSNKSYDISQLGQMLLRQSKYSVRKSTTFELDVLCDRFNVTLSQDVALCIAQLFIHIANEDENLL